MKRKHYLYLACAALLTGVLAIVCINPKRPLASDYQRSYTHAIAPGEETALGDAIAPGVRAHPGQSGFKLITTGKDALMIRLSMIEAAERSLDIQYYMIDDDITGKVLLEAILRAADRGVRVRMLIDDLNLHGSDITWPLLNAHRNIEIRIFNPFATRDEPLFTRISDAVTGLWQFSKRMHNKVMIADNQVALAGGRNLGDAYFDVSDDFNFRDVDVLAAGPIAARISQSFDAYWNDDESFPLAALHKVSNDAAALARLRQELQLHWQVEMRNGTIVPQAPLAEQLKGGTALAWANAELAADAPSKIDASLPHDSMPAFRLDRVEDHVQHEFIIVTPYFIPGMEGMERLEAMLEKGVKVRALTNSLASTDVVAAHAGYRHYRLEMVRDGVDLYEMKPIAGPHPHSHHFSSASRRSLHSKIYIADRRDVIIGSYNFDPRSENLNTEMALDIHSPVLAAELADKFAKATAPAASFHLEMQGRHLEWISDGKHYESEPDAGFWRSIKADVLGVIPMGDQL